MTDSVFIRLAGPVQSWGKPAITGNFVKTDKMPTTTALRGLIAGGLGYRRNEWPDWISDIEFTVREERRPTFVDDFHTIGSREDEWDFRRRLAISQGLKAKSAKSVAYKPGVGATVVVRRTYLADAEFIVRITCEGHTEDIDRAVSDPVFVTYLGRKAFSATFPLYLGTGKPELLQRIPNISKDTQLGDSTTVNQYFLAKGAGTRPATVVVPRVSTRAEWMGRVGQLGLKLRSTIQEN